MTGVASNETSSPPNSTNEPDCLFVEVNLEVSRDVFIVNIITSVINSLFCISAVTANVLVIIAIWKKPSLRSSTNILLCCLASADLLVGSIGQPAYVSHKIGENKGNFQVYCVSAVVMEMSGWTGLGVSIMTLTAISLERYVSLFFPLRYHSLVTSGRVAKSVTCFWFSMLLLGAFRFWFLKNSTGSFFIIALISVSLLVTTSAYGKIFLLARHQRVRVRDETRLSVQLRKSEAVALATNNAIRQKKSSFTMAYVFGLFLLCYSPFLCCMIVYRIYGFVTNVKIAVNISSTIAFVNSSLNPLLYCWRMRDIRREITKLLKGNTNHIFVVAVRIEPRTQTDSWTE